MNQPDWKNLVDKRLARIRETLIAKNAEYVPEGLDVLHNFVRAGNMLGCCKESALVGMFTKHIISLLDIVDKINKDPTNIPSQEMLAEKIGDSLSYLLLLEACIEDRRAK